MSLADKLRTDGENLAADLAQELGDRRLPSKLARELNYDGRVDRLAQTFDNAAAKDEWPMAYGGTMPSKPSGKYEVAPAHTHHEFEQLRELQDQIAMLIAIVGEQQEQITKLQQLQR